MKKNLYLICLLANGILLNAQILTHVDNDGLFYVSKGALVYNGGGLQMKDGGRWENRGNVMVVGAATDVFKTITAAGLDKSESNGGGNFINRLNEPTAYASSNSTAEGNNYTYGQLYISGLSQENIKGIIDQEFRNVNHGGYEQIALPFYQKTLSTLSAELGKTFNNTRWSQNEILKWRNSIIVYDLANTASKTSDPTGYYVLGNKNNTLNVSTVTRTMKGVPYADGSSLQIPLGNAGAGVVMGSSGQNRNQYNERYNTYIGDSFDLAAGKPAWNAETFGKNFYQLANPFLTNIDLRGLFMAGDPNYISNIVGLSLEYGNGTVQYTQNVGGGAAQERKVTWDTVNNVPLGDVDWLIVRPGSVFAIKLSDNSNPTAVLDFNSLRRFNYIPRSSSTPYSVTAEKALGNSSTVKQLGVTALDAAGNALGTTYYAVSPSFVTGHGNTTVRQAASSTTDVIGTYEEALDGGIDNNYKSSYWLNINEANEVDFMGKALPVAMFSDKITSLKFELRENAELVNSGTHLLSSGIGFYYKLQNGNVMPIAQGQVIPVHVINSGSFANLFYGEPSVTLSDADVKMSRTMIVFNSNIDNYIVRFDPNWKSASIKVFDMSGKLVHSKDKVKTDTDYIINLNKSLQATYIVNVISDKGQIVNTKIIR